METPEFQGRSRSNMTLVAGLIPISLLDFLACRNGTSFTKLLEIALTKRIQVADSQFLSWNLSFWLVTHSPEIVFFLFSKILALGKPPQAPRHHHECLGDL